ncbi:MAG: CvpA family protein [Candidatus Aceula lacicola]|nr:CvpA family protein [Candidatus Aceula lacicola]
MAALIIRSLYIGIKRGFADEMLHLLGLFLSIFIIFQYYPALGNFLESKIFFKSTLANSLAFVFLWILTAIVAKLVRFGIHTLLKIEARSLFDKGGGLVVAIFQGLLICSLALWFMRTTGSEYVIRNIGSSFSSSRLAKIAPTVYRTTFNGIIAKYFPKERINQDVLSHKKDSLKK